MHGARRCEPRPQLHDQPPDLLCHRGVGRDRGAEQHERPHREVTVHERVGDPHALLAAPFGHAGAEDVVAALRGDRHPRLDGAQHRRRRRQGEALQAAIGCRRARHDARRRSSRGRVREHHHGGPLREVLRQFGAGAGDGLERLRPAAAPRFDAARRRS